MIVVTGGAGFIGSAFVWKLNTKGVTDILIVDDLNDQDGDAAHPAAKWKNLVPLRYDDYLDKADFLKLISADGLPDTVEAVVHMGACSSTTEADANYLMSNNFKYTQALCSWCVEKGLRFINASSAATYGDGTLGFDDKPGNIQRLRPLNMYGYTKQLFDLWALKQGLLSEIVSLKFFNVFGPNEFHKGDMMSVACKAHAQIKDGGSVKLFKSHRPDYPDGGQLRDFVYVKDCVEIMWRLLAEKRIGGTFNVGTGKARSFADFVSAVFGALGREPKIEFIPMPELLRGKYQYYTQAENARLCDALGGFEYMSLEDAVRDYVTQHLEQDERYLSA
jgi:ADP-L-glycero-D-manno-heptose 6-epimerase